MGWQALQVVAWSCITCIVMMLGEGQQFQLLSCRAQQITAPDTLLAWAPQGGFWLAVVSVLPCKDGSQASLAVVDGRSGQVKSDTIIATVAGHLMPMKLIWSSSGLALMVGFHHGGWLKVYVSFADRARVGGKQSAFQLGNEDA